jgi:hypothetical protein
VLLILAATVMVTAGCSGKQKVPSVEPLDARAKRAVLQPGELPNSWARVPASSQSDHEQAWAQLRDCLSGGQGLDGGAVSATSGAFSSGGARVESTVAYVNADRASEFAFSLASTGSRACGQTALAAEAGRNAPPGSAVKGRHVEPLPLSRAGGGSAWGMRSTTTYSAGPPIVTDLVVLVKDGALGRLVFVNEGGPFPQDLERSLVEKVAGRA